jgi:hypothetical protein
MNLKKYMYKKSIRFVSKNEDGNLHEIQYNPKVPPAYAIFKLDHDDELITKTRDVITEARDVITEARDVTIVHDMTTAQENTVQYRYGSTLRHHCYDRCTCYPGHSPPRGYNQIPVHHSTSH